MEENFIQDNSGKWYIPDVSKSGDLIKLREKRLLKEFEEYLNSKGKLKLFRTEAIKIGFARMWKEKKYQILLMEGVNKVIYENNEYTVSTDKNVNLVSKIVECVVNNNGIIRNITNEEPSLENVFLSLTGKTLRE